MKKIIFILKSEGLALFITAIWIYAFIGASWWLFTILLLAPDLFMVGYVKNSKLGALIYNIGHTYVTPSLLLGVFFIFHTPILLPLSIIWIAHISMDRFFGYGLKLDASFRETHLGTLRSKKSFPTIKKPL